MNNFLAIIVWSVLTIIFYVIAKKIYRRFQLWFLAPVILAPAFLAAILIGFEVSYEEYFSAVNWLVLMIGPATAAFAVPIYERRKLILKHYKALLLATVIGSVTSIFLVIFLCDLFALDEDVRLSLVPRSVTTPFAINIAAEIGGKSDLAAIFVAITGIFGSVVGEIMLYKIPFKSSLARGVAFGVAAHTIGSNKAYQIDKEDGAMAALAMIMVGITNILAVPLIMMIL